MKRAIITVLVIVFVFSLVGCDIEPVFKTYGETVHDAVKPYYDDYEILELVHIKVNNRQSAKKLCIVNDKMGDLDIVCISYEADGDSPDGISTVQCLLVNNLEIGKTYSTGDFFDGLTVEFVICDKPNIPDSTVQKEKFKLDAKALYLCITSVEQ